MTRAELIAALERGEASNELSMAIHEVATGSSRGWVSYCFSRDAMLPGAEGLWWWIEKKADGTWSAYAWKSFDGPVNNPRYEGHAKTEALARRIAECKALVKEWASA